MSLNYDPDTMTLTTLDEIPEELVPLQQALRKFIANSAEHWSASSLANFLGMDVHTLKRFVRVPFSQTRAHTILVLRPIEDAEVDSLRYVTEVI